MISPKPSLTCEVSTTQFALSITAINLTPDMSFDREGWGLPNPNSFSCFGTKQNTL